MPTQACTELNPLTSLLPLLHYYCPPYIEPLHIVVSLSNGHILYYLFFPTTKGKCVNYIIYVIVYDLKVRKASTRSFKSLEVLVSVLLHELMHVVVVYTSM